MPAPCEPRVFVRDCVVQSVACDLGRKLRCALSYLLHLPPLCRLSPLVPSHPVLPLSSQSLSPSSCSFRSIPRSLPVSSCPIPTSSSAFPPFTASSHASPHRPLHPTLSGPVHCQLFPQIESSFLVGKLFSATLPRQIYSVSGSFRTSSRGGRCKHSGTRRRRRRRRRYSLASLPDSNLIAASKDKRE